MSHDPVASNSPQLARHGLLALLIAGSLFVAVGPTLTWLEFSSGSENLLTATVVEMHAGAPWVIPSLNGDPRVRKPPLPAWVAARLVPRSVIASLDSPDVPTRHAAYQRLAWSVRWPALVLSCLIVLTTYELGRTIGGARFGVIACAVCASSLLLLRYGRSATTDIHLAFWVTVTNLCLAKAWFRARPWPWLPLAGAAAGLAFLSKGPVGLAQSVAPMLIFAAVRHVWCQKSDGNGSEPASILRIHHGRRVWLAIAGAMLVFICVAVPWFVYVMQTVPNAWEVFKTEVTREGATTLHADPIHTYLVILPMMAPWVIFLIAGMAECVRDWRASPARHFSLLLLLVPIIIMSMVRDKNERYLLPMAAAGALVAAFAIEPQLRPSARQSRTDQSLRQLHVVLLFILAVGVPLSGAVAVLETGGEAWWGWGFGLGLAAALSTIPVVLNFIYSRHAWAIIPATMLLMFAAYAVFLNGYRNSLNGRSEMLAIADAVREAHPSAEVCYVDQRESPKAMPQDLQIYLNRVVRTIYGPAEPPKPSGERVVIMLRREDEPPPALPGWTEFARRPWGRRSWHALVGE